MKCLLNALVSIAFFAVCSSAFASGESKAKLSKRDEVMAYLQKRHNATAIADGQKLAREVKAKIPGASERYHAKFKDPYDRIMLSALIGHGSLENVFIPKPGSVVCKDFHVDWEKLEREAKAKTRRDLIRNELKVARAAVPEAICEKFFEEKATHAVKALLGF